VRHGYQVRGPSVLDGNHGSIKESIERLQMEPSPYRMSASFSLRNFCHRDHFLLDFHCPVHLGRNRVNMESTSTTRLNNKPSKHGMSSCMKLSTIVVERMGVTIRRCRWLHVCTIRSTRFARGGELDPHGEGVNSDSDFLIHGV
jgi:hypothetical protein